MPESDCCQVVVVDDVVRFALHVWRFLGRSIGFGVGTVKADDSAYFFDQGKPAPLLTADGRAAVWWVSAESQWRSGLEAVREKISDRRTIFLLDVKPKDEETLDTDPTAETYDADTVADWVTDNWPLLERGSNPIWLVSSYSGSLKRRKVWPKSVETLQRIAETLPDLQTLAEIGRDEALDILVTGAGFEFRYNHRRRESDDENNELPKEKRSAARPMDVCFGLPETRNILATMGSPFGDERKLDTSGSGFPWPLFYPEGWEVSEQMKMLADAKKLDEWWDLLLETELRNRLGSNVSLEKRRKLERIARRFEIKLRDAYRQAISRSDWGHMSQSVCAARLPWCAWLTTNYTGFADRATTLSNQRRTRDLAPTSALPWQVISTANEALVLMRELQDREERTKGEDRTPIDQADYRPLFKLHGDVSHLQTMAIAGHDKELYSMLSLPVDSLYQVYSATEKYLIRMVEENQDKRVQWHIVGHGLQDAALVKMFVQVARVHGQKPMTFKVVSPSHPECVAQQLKNAFVGEVGQDLLDIEEVPLDAASYLARLGGRSGR